MEQLVVNDTNLPGVLLIKPPVFEDHRGEYVELYNTRDYPLGGVKIQFVQDDISVSRRNVLRGIHGDNSTWKLISCLYGSIYLVVVHYPAGPPGFSDGTLRWEAFVLSDKNRHQILVPPCHGVGHLVLSEQAIFHYKQSTYYDRASQFTDRWDDPELGIWWPVSNPILSKRDSA